MRLARATYYNLLMVLSFDTAGIQNRRQAINTTIAAPIPSYSMLHAEKPAYTIKSVDPVPFRAQINVCTRCAFNHKDLGPILLAWAKVHSWGKLALQGKMGP